jgi:hypothetical protein
VSSAAACRRDVAGSQEVVRQQLAQQQRQQQQQQGAGPAQLQHQEAKLQHEEQLLGAEQVRLCCLSCVCLLLIRTLCTHPADACVFVSILMLV